MISDESPYVLKFAVYDNKLNFLVKKEFEGSIIFIADQVLEYAKTFNATSAKIVPGIAQRIEQVSYPGVSIREAILNAIIHAEFRYPSNIKVEFFPDKLKITNPGAILNSSLEEAMEGVQTFRNPGLVNIFMRLGFIENYGTGLKRIVEAYEHEDKKPVFKDLDRYFIIELSNLNQGIDPVNEPENDFVNKPEKTVEERIALLIIDNPTISKDEMAKRIGVSRVTITRALKVSTIIKRVGPDKGGYWEVLK